jgi:hypothetical protein
MVQVVSQFREFHQWHNRFSLRSSSTPHREIANASAKSTHQPGDQYKTEKCRIVLLTRP